jgi:hypothetical protein
MSEQVDAHDTSADEQDTNSEPRPKWAMNAAKAVVAVLVLYFAYGLVFGDDDNVAVADTDWSSSPPESIADYRIAMNPDPGSDEWDSKHYCYWGSTHIIKDGSILQYVQGKPVGENYVDYRVHNNNIEARDEKSGKVWILFNLTDDGFPYFFHSTDFDEGIAFGHCPS